MSLPEIPLAPGRTEAPCSSQPCSQCCHDTEMVLTEADVARLEPLAPGDWYSVAPDGFLQLRTRAGPLARGSTAGSPCVFLDDGGRCTVWEARPEGCRIYPAVWDEQLREAVLDADYCPHTDGLRLVPWLSGVARELVERLHAERDRRQQ